MVGIFVITVIGATIIASLGLWSARIAKAESEARLKMQQEKRQREVEEAIMGPSRNNEENPAAMDLAGPTGADSVVSLSGWRSRTPRRRSAGR